MISQKIKIKPLSVNKCWQGRRFKTPTYKTYQTELLLLLKSKKLNFDKIELYVRYGFSSANADLDNPQKPFQDILSKKYGFNDSKVYRLILEREQVKKGNEYIYFEIKEYVVQHNITTNQK